MINLRPYQSKDLEGIIHYENQDFNKIDESSFKSLYLDNELIKIYIIEKNSSMIGYMIIWQDEDKSQIYSIYILKDHRRLGYAYESLKKIQEIWIDQGVLQMSLEVNVNNHPAIHLYEKLGFKKVSVRKNYYHNHDDAYLMVKDMRK